MIDGAGDAADPLVLNTGSNTIQNAGTLLSNGAGELLVQSAVTNTGTMLANSSGGAGRLIVSGVVSNSGLMEATNGALVSIENAVNNTGTIEALNGGDVVISGVTTGSGAGTITAGTLEFGAAASTNITFTGSGTLKLDTSSSYTGSVSGFTIGDTFDLTDINFATVQTPVFSGDATGGTLTVTDGVHTANNALLGNYLASTFVASNDGHGGTFITDPPAAARARAQLLRVA